MLPNSSNHKYYEKRVEAWVRMHRRRSSYTAVYSPIRRYNLVTFSTIFDHDESRNTVKLYNWKVKSRAKLEVEFVMFLNLTVESW